MTQPATIFAPSAQLARVSCLAAGSAFVDIDYRENCRGALTEAAHFLAPARVVAYASPSDYALSRMRGTEPACHLFLQIDVIEIAFREAALLSALARSSSSPGALTLRSLELTSTSSP